MLLSVTNREVVIVTIGGAGYTGTGGYLLFAEGRCGVRSRLYVSYGAETCGAQGAYGFGKMSLKDARIVQTLLRPVRNMRSPLGVAYGRDPFSGATWPAIFTAGVKPVTPVSDPVLSHAPSELYISALRPA